MKLEEVLALHPRGADAATLRQAISQAEATRDELRQHAAELDRTRATGLLTVEAKTILKAEDDAAQARLAADRIDALLPAMRDDLHGAVGREALDALRAEVDATRGPVEALEAWWREEWPGLPARIRIGLALETSAAAALAQLRNSIGAAYARQEVRDAGPLGVELPVMPRSAIAGQFPNWRTA